MIKKIKMGSVLLNIIYPVGSIYMSLNSANPSTIFGGTWEQISKGRTLVGVDSSDTDFNIAEKIGGSKYIQNHNHKKIVKWSDAQALTYGLTDTIHYTGKVYNNTTEISSGDISGVNTGNSGNLPPYFTCYIWLRTN